MACRQYCSSFASDYKNNVSAQCWNPIATILNSLTNILLHSSRTEEEGWLLLYFRLMEYHKLLQEYSPGSESVLVEEGGGNWFIPKTGPELVRRVLFMLLASSPLRNLYIDSQKRMVLTRHMLLGRHPSEAPISAYFDFKGRTDAWNVPGKLRGLEKFADGELFLDLGAYPVVSRKMGARWVFPLNTSSAFNSSHLALLKRHSQQLVDSNDFSSTRGWKRILITFLDNMRRGGHHRVLYKLPDGKSKEHYFTHFLAQLTWILIRNILDNKGNPAITRLIEESTKLTKDKVCPRKTGTKNQNFARVAAYYDRPAGSLKCNVSALAYLMVERN